MAMPIDSYLGIHTQALKLGARRSELLAANMANADTPNYKARDVDFKAALPASGPTGTHLQMREPNGTARQNHITLTNSASSANAPTLYRAPFAPSLDGNTVDAEVEQANFVQNSIHYQASLSFVNAKFRSLMTAITGQ